MANATAKDFESDHLFTGKVSQEELRKLLRLPGFSRMDGAAGAGKSLHAYFMLWRSVLNCRHRPRL